MKKYITKELSKILITTITITSILIISKNNINIKNKIEYIITDYNISFIDMKNIYNKYLGGIYLFNKTDNTQMVFNTKISYKEIKDNKDYLELLVTPNYLIPSLTDGVVVFIGNKKKYGNTIIIKTKNNVNIWYGNISNTSLKLYDTVSKGTYIGEVDNQTLYLAYTKGNKAINAIEMFKKQQ